MENPFMWIILIVVGILLLLIVVLLLSRPQGGSEAKQLDKGWKELARRTSLKYTPPEPLPDNANVRGHYRGYPVKLRLRQRTALGRDTQIIVTYTRIELGLNNKNRIYARLFKKGAFKHTDRAFGVPNVTFDIAELDNRFDVKSRPAEFVPAVISNHPTIYQLLLKVRTEHNVGIEIEGDMLTFEQQGIETSPDYLEPILDLLAEFAQAVEQGK